MPHTHNSPTFLWDCPIQWEQKCKLHMHSGINDTAVQIWDRSGIFQRLCLPLKGISIEKTYTGKLSYTISIAFTQKVWGLTRDRLWSRDSGVIDTAVTKIGNFVVDFFANSNPYSERLELVYQGPGGSCLMKKKPDVENLLSGSLSSSDEPIYCIINVSGPIDKSICSKETGHLWTYYIYMTVFIRNAANLAHILPKTSRTTFTSEVFL
jgi:hypothetical protein